jgi:uncharacterized protein DUF2806
MTDNPLVNIGDLTKPATVLIEKISDAVGGIFKPYQMVRVARAEAEAELVRAEAQIHITDLQRRAMYRFLEEEAGKQANIEEITQRALPLLAEDASPENIANDWITNFFDKSRIVSDQQMQQLWSRVLAEEANSPGGFSRRTVNLLADLDKSDAELFTKLCGFGWTMGSVTPLIFDTESAVYNAHDISFTSLIHLESLSLVQFNHATGFRILHLSKRINVRYYGRGIELTLPKDSDNDLEIGKVILTKAGKELARVCAPPPAEGFFDFVYDRWAANGFIPKRDIA